MIKLLKDILRELTSIRTLLFQVYKKTNSKNERKLEDLIEEIDNWQNK